MLNIFFDVDYTILSLDSVLRPGTKEVFERLIDDGHRVYIWSGLGKRWEFVRKHGLEPLVSGVYEKPTSDHHQMLEELGVDVFPDFVVDDHPEVVEAFGGMLVKRYYYGEVDGIAIDDELHRVYDAIVEFAETRSI